MSNEENYWSDENESENELVQDSRDLPPLETDSEEEEEYYNMLELVKSKLKDDTDYNSICSDISNKEEKSSKKRNSRKRNSKNKKVFIDLNDNNEKKVWKSRRMRDKKGPEVIKRKFNPRLPPPGNKFKNVKRQKEPQLNLNMDKDFPTL